MDFAHEQHTKAPEASLTGAGIGGVIGAVLGWLVGIGTIGIPGLGAFIAAGPLLAMLSGIAVGGIAGGIAGALIGLGMPEFEAFATKEKSRKANILLSVHVQNNRVADRAREILERCGAQHIATSSEMPVSHAT